ncbi:MAG: NUDIX hydrolase [Planctomycetaceae bacterium]|nr:NUDIX hydrolase [Planctomycetaceae bacterium]
MAVNRLPPTDPSIEPVLAQLDEYLGRYPDEVAVVRRIRGLAEMHPDCFHRTCRPGHLTASAWVTTRNGKEALLVHHRKLERWLQPGGHADGDNHLARVALREASEETGLNELELVGGFMMPLDVDVHEIPARYHADGRLIEDAHEHHDVRFLVVSPTAAPPAVSDESHDVRWFAVEDLPSVTQEESVLRLARKAAPLLGSE